MARASSSEVGLKNPTPMRPRLGSVLESAVNRKNPSRLLGSQLLVRTRASSIPPVTMCRPPPSVRVLAMSGLLGWLFVAWAYWIDRHREPAMRKALA